MSASFIVIGLSILLFVATEFFFPIDSKDSNAIKQKHFWSIMLTIFSMVLGFSIKSSYETQREVANVGSVFQKITSPEMQMEFQEIFTQYHKHFHHAQPVLKGWALESLGQLRDDMSNGYISLPRELASREIGKVYSHAKESIVATNVGSTKFYFSDSNYVDSNLSVLRAQVPVVRFYLYHRNQKIVMRNGEVAKDINEFFIEVEELHKKLNSVYSVIIDVENANLKARDLLLLDNKFVAETELAQNWEPIKAKATEDEKNLRDARKYFLDLMAFKHNSYIVAMPDAEVRKKFPKYEDLQLNPNEKLAERIFYEVMQKIKANQ